ncbi:hypothetical protein Golomagni_02404 [Golovinomyces magnicellulatus]|nr:hypothetical protein Golomagni_02404 [Golovinomyces magnicellulatus]
MPENNITPTSSECHPPATTVKEALDRARECAICAQKTAVIALLESEIGMIWKKILAIPDYLMSRDEPALRGSKLQETLGSDIGIINSQLAEYR